MVMFVSDILFTSSQYPLSSRYYRFAAVSFWLEREIKGVSKISSETAYHQITLKLLTLQAVFR
jgi:hypothetical protein